MPARRVDVVLYRASGVGAVRCGGMRVGGGVHGVTYFRVQLESVWLHAPTMTVNTGDCFTFATVKTDAPILFLAQL